MKKILIFAAVLIAATSCKKESVIGSGSTCYKCTFGVVNGNTLPDVIVCTDGRPNPPNLDAAGNEYSWYCTKR